VFYEVTVAFRSRKGRSGKHEIIHENKTVTLIIYFFLYIIINGMTASTRKRLLQSYSRFPARMLNRPILWPPCYSEHKLLIPFFFPNNIQHKHTHKTYTPLSLFTWKAYFIITIKTQYLTIKSDELHLIQNQHTIFIRL
jgi:hypothetical protein